MMLHRFLDTPRRWGVILAGICLFLLGSASVVAQTAPVWNAYSSMRKVLGTTFDAEGRVWAATTGGVFRYDPATDSFAVFRTTEGLLRLSAISVGYDDDSKLLYVGSDNGVISIYRTQQNRWSYSSEISTVSRPDKKINGFRFHNGKTYVLTAFGVAVYNPTDSTFGDSYTRFGNLPPFIAANDILFFRDTVWVATEFGLAWAPERGKVLTDPKSWTVAGLQDGLSDTAYSLAVGGGNLQIGTGGGVFQRIDGTFQRRGDLARAPFKLTRAGDVVLAWSSPNLFRYNHTTYGFEQIQSAGTDIQVVAAASNGMFALATNRDGVAIPTADTLRYLFPNSPVSNAFTGLVKGKGGGIWVGAATGEEGSGISKLQNNVWESFSFPATPNLPSNGTWCIGNGADSSVWVGLFPGGFTRINDDGWSNYNAQNSPLIGINGKEKEYVVGAGIAEQNGRTWLVNWDNTSAIGPVLVVQLRPGEQAADGSGFVSYRSPFPRTYRYLAVDRNGTKWLGADGALSLQGLQWFRDTGSAPATNRGVWGMITTNDGLPSNQQSALLVDPDGEVWIGTPAGLVVLVNPSFMLNRGRPTFRTVRALRDVGIRAIAVDALNRKWVGTDQGVYVMNLDGTELLERYTVDNSPLVDNAVRSILTDYATGDVYIGTANGMNRVSTPAVESPETVTTIVASPQPFLLPATEPLRLTGLPTDASVKILTVSGVLVRQFESPGGAVAFWDGFDNNGRMVPSGIYLVTAGTEQGEQTVVGKIAVVQQ
ncbi:MAG: hypothetical protein IT211_02025 [Armatimonadetes bacterium]|nr:hypothetical protein [Armatimonadota bacterium]